MAVSTEPRDYRRLTTFTNFMLILLVLAAPMVLQYGCAKQERIEIARAGQ